jgi:hypothetical protein
VQVGEEIFIGLGTKCEERFRWTNQNYISLTDEDHYNLAQNGTVPADTQKWVITSKSGCLTQTNLFSPPISQEYADGHRLAVDPACETGHDTEFWAIASPFHVNESLHDLDQPFTLVQAAANRTRRLAYYANTTLPYSDPDAENGKNCTCVDFENDPLGALMVSQAHVHETRPDKTESYFYGRDHCKFYTKTHHEQNAYSPTWRMFLLSQATVMSWSSRSSPRHHLHRTHITMHSNSPRPEPPCAHTTHHVPIVIAH